MNIRLIQLYTTGTAQVYVSENGANMPVLSVDLTVDEQSLAASLSAGVEGCMAMEIDPDGANFDVVCFGSQMNMHVESEALPDTLRSSITDFWNRCLNLAQTPVTPPEAAPEASVVDPTPVDTVPQTPSLS